MLGIIACILAHAFLTRLVPGRSAVTLFLVSGTAVGIALTSWAFRTYGPATIEFVAAVLVYAAFCELYLFLFTLTLTSVSANILVRLWDGPKTQSELDGLYENAAMVEARLTRMRAAGMVRTEVGTLQVTQRGKRIVRSYRFLRTLFRHV